MNNVPQGVYQDNHTANDSLRDDSLLTYPSSAVCVFR